MLRELGRYLRYHEARNSTAKTIAWRSDSIGSFFNFLTSRSLPVEFVSLDADNVRDWIASQRERGLSQSTLATRITSLKAFAHWCVAEEYVPRDPLRRVPVPHIDDKAMPIFEPDEVDQLLAACDRRTITGLRDRAVLLLLYSTLVRSAELRLLQHDDIDWRRGLILIRRGKGGIARTVPLSGNAVAALDKYLSWPYRKAQKSPCVLLTDAGNPLTANGFAQIFVSLQQKTGVDACRQQHSCSGQHPNRYPSGWLCFIHCQLGNTPQPKRHNHKHTENQPHLDRFGY